VREFDRKWLRGGAAADEPLLGSADIQSLADLGNSDAVVKEMRLVPFSARDRSRAPRRIESAFAPFVAKSSIAHPDEAAGGHGYA